MKDRITAAFPCSASPFPLCLAYSLTSEQNDLKNTSVLTFRHAPLSRSFEHLSSQHLCTKATSQELNVFRNTFMKCKLMLASCYTSAIIGEHAKHV